jgi:Plasmid pRiA4b ORF-3-like protein
MRTVLVALVAGLGVALAKAGAVVFTGSSALAAEASHSLAILQAALGWENYHLRAFSFGEEEFEPRDPELALDFSDERRVTLGELTDIGARFRYTYDFGDNWEHEILVEDLLDPDPDTPTTQSSWPPKEPVHQRTAAVPGATPISRPSSPTPTTSNTNRCSNGSASITAPSSTPTPSQATTSTTNSHSPAQAGEIPRLNPLTQYVKRSASFTRQPLAIAIAPSAVLHEQKRQRGRPVVPMLNRRRSVCPVRLGKRWSRGTPTS